MRKVLEPIWPWVAASIITLVASFAFHKLGHKELSFDRGGALVCFYGVILGCIYAKFGPVSGAFAEVKVKPSGEQVTYVPGEEFKKHLYTGFVLSGIGTLIWAFGASV